MSKLYTFALMLLAINCVSFLDFSMMQINVLQILLYPPNLFLETICNDKKVMMSRLTIQKLFPDAKANSKVAVQDLDCGEKKLRYRVGEFFYDMTIENKRTYVKLNPINDLPILEVYFSNSRPNYGDAMFAYFANIYNSVYQRFTCESSKALTFKSFSKQTTETDFYWGDKLYNIELINCGSEGFYLHLAISGEFYFLNIDQSSSNNIFEKAPLTPSNYKIVHTLEKIIGKPMDTNDVSGYFYTLQFANELLPVFTFQAHYAESEGKYSTWTLQVFNKEKSLSFVCSFPDVVGGLIAKNFKEFAKEFLEFELFDLREIECKATATGGAILEEKNFKECIVCDKVGRRLRIV